MSTALVRHFSRLGVQTVAEYRRWCSEHGFSTRLDKSSLKLEQEVRAFQEARIQVSFAKKPRTAREIIQHIFRGRAAPSDTPDRMWSNVVRIYASVIHNTVLSQAALKLLCQAAECDGFFREGYAEIFGLPPYFETYTTGLLAVIHAHSDWMRPIETWKPRCRHPRQQFSSLLRHLFAEYPVPLFMDSVWFLEDSPEVQRQQAWFIHLGRGLNLRMVNLPVTYTRRMAHDFMQAPAHYSVYKALRWGQILSLGGTARLVEAVCATSLSEDFSDDEFWLSVFRFFIAHPQLNLSHVGPIIDFLKDQRQPGFQISRDGNRIEVPAPNPKFSMKGRTPQSLIRQMEVWHRRLEDEDYPDVRWEPLGIPGYEELEGSLEDGTLRKWTVCELLTAAELVAEGRAMHHCVATYINSCVEGASSIWSIRLESREGITSHVTVEVRRVRNEIVQARGRYNSALIGYQRVILDRWAKIARLTVGSYA